VLNAVANSVSDSFVGYTISDLIVRILVAPFTALAAAVLFFELKAIRGEPVLGTDASGQVTPGQVPPGQVTPSGEPTGGPAPTPAEAPAPPPGPEAPPPGPEAPPPGPEAPPPPGGPTTGTQGTGSGPPG